MNLKCVNNAAVNNINTQVIEKESKLGSIPSEWIRTPSPSFVLYGMKGSKITIKKQVAKNRERLIG